LASAKSPFLPALERGAAPFQVARRFFRKSIPAALGMIYEGRGAVKTGTGDAGPERAMDVGEFEDLIDRLGEDLTRWPDDRRLAAEALLASSSAARALLDEAKLIRAALSAPPVRAPAGLADRIVTAAARQKAEQPAPASEDEPKPESADIKQPG
jgi:hypothetical protein